MMTLAEARAAMERAVALARAKQHDQAQEQARALLAEHPRDVNLLHQAGVVMAIGGAHEEALRLFNAALEIFPNFHYTEMEIANVFMAMQRPEDAVWWFQKAARSAPTYALAYRRAGETMHLLGRHGQALELLRQANAQDPTEPDVAAVLVNQLIFHNRRDLAVEVFAKVAAAGRMRDVDFGRYLSLLTELGRHDEVVELAAKFPDNIRTSAGYETAVLAGHAALAASHDRAAMVAAAEARQQDTRWLSTPAVVAALRSAIAERQPLSLIRVGDGEARFLAYCDPALRTRISPAQIEMFGDVPFRNWFRLPIAEADPGEVLRLQAATITAIEQADILGVSSAERLATDNTHVGYLSHMEGVVGSVIRTERKLRLTDAFIHLDLHRTSPFYRDIFAGLDFLAVISPHPGLAKRLGTLHGIRQVAEYVLPGESRLPPEQWRGHPRPHFPDIYHELCQGLMVPKPGAVFLVAGGLLAKIYCNIIRQRGGIAIDAGSIVDGWMGLNTRPGVYDKPQDWALPAEAAA
jgi:GT-D fold-like domain